MINTMGFRIAVLVLVALTGVAGASGSDLDGNAVASFESATTANFPLRPVPVQDVQYRTRIADSEIRKPEWAEGEWVPDFAVANVLGTCVQTWKCTIPSGASIMRSSDSRLITTAKQNTPGACAVTDNPKKCGTCVAPSPATTCKYCVEPLACSDSSLGWRTRQALCCN